MHHLAEVALTQPKERRAVDLGVTANVVVKRGAEGVAGGVRPNLASLVGAVDENGLRAPVLLTARQVIAALQDQDALARRGQTVGQRGATRPAADHDEVMVIRPQRSPTACADRNPNAFSHGGQSAG